MSKPVTNYYMAWRKFRQSNDYRVAKELMVEKGFKPKYAGNVLRLAFDAGWGNRKINFIHPKQSQ